MSTATDSPPKFIRKEREHIAALQARLDWLHSGRSREPSHIPGESNALAWVLSLLEGGVEPIEIRIERIERQLRQHGGKLAQIERELYEEEE